MPDEIGPEGAIFPLPSAKSAHIAVSLVAGDNALNQAVNGPRGAEAIHHRAVKKKKRENEMKNILIAATLAASLVATNLFAAEATAPLAPGKPAGVKQAQGEIGWSTAAWVGAIVVGGVLLGSSVSQKGAVAPNGTSATAATTT